MHARYLALLVLIGLSSTALWGQVLIGPTFGGNIIGETPDVRLALPIIVPVSTFLEVQGELAWTNRYNGSFIRKLEVDTDNFSSYVSYNELAFMLRPNLSTRQATVYLLAGPSIAYGRRIRFHYLEKSRVNYREVNLSEVGLKQWDVGLQAGLGVSKTLLNRVRLQIEYRLYYGVQDLDDEDEYSVYNQAQYLSMGFLFPIGQ